MSIKTIVLLMIGAIIGLFIVSHNKKDVIDPAPKMTVQEASKPPGSVADVFKSIREPVRADTSTLPHN